MAIGKKSTVTTTATGGPGVHGTAEEQVEVGAVMGGPGITLLGLRLFRELLKLSLENPPTIEEFAQLPLDQMILARRGLKMFEKLFFDQSTGLDKELGLMIFNSMAELGETEHIVGGYIAKLRDGRTSDIVSEIKLVEAGVSVDVIAQSREPGTPYTYVEIRKIKGATNE